MSVELYPIAPFISDKKFGLMKYTYTSGFSIIIFLAISAFLFSTNNHQNYNKWDEFLGGPERTHYSSLTQINIDNVKSLKIAWEYHTADSGQVQCNPIIVNGILYATTASAQVFALNAATGKEIWRFKDSNDPQWFNTSRGVSYWEEGDDKRIFSSAGKWLYCINANTGKLVESFGEGGRMDLHNGLPDSAKDKFICSNTPGTIHKNLIIMPVRLSEGPDAAPGDIRAFDVKTGKMVWIFHTIPYPNEFGYTTWQKNNYQNTEVGAANNWAGMAIDRDREILFVPTGSAGYDFYGGNRAGQNLFANCLIALDANTGKRLWHFQFVHHDVWDRDLPSAPTLVTVNRNGKRVDAVAQITKSGFVFVFDRVTGKSLFPTKEISVPTNAVAGEKPWPTQPVPIKPVPFSRQTMTEKDINPYAENKEDLLKTLKSIRHKHQFELPSKEGTLIFPGYDGGGEWGGAGYDPETGLLYVNSNEMPWIMTIIDKPKNDKMAQLSAGERSYLMNCTTCHGQDKKGNPKSGYPPLINIGSKRDRSYLYNIIHGGKGMMPGFSYLSTEQKNAIVNYLLGEEKKEIATTNSTPEKDAFPNVPYTTTGYNKFLDKDGYPAINPPWGQLNAINLNTGEYVWKTTLGEFKELTAKGIAPTGCENYGGPVVTAGGVLFIAATKDGMFRAFDKNTGRILWETKLPAAGFATPATYAVDGKQYIVIACGGTKLGTPKGDSYVAFALP